MSAVQWIRSSFARGLFPARSTGVAIFVGDWAIGQLWLFWVAPIVGGLLGAAVYRFIGGAKD